MEGWNDLLSIRDWTIIFRCWQQLTTPTLVAPYGLIHAQELILFVTNENVLVENFELGCGLWILYCARLRATS